MNNIQLPIDPIQILMAALLQAASMFLALLTSLPWWALSLLGLLLVYRLLRPELGVSPAKNPHPKRPRRRRW